MEFRFFRLFLILGFICSAPTKAIVHKVDIWQKSFGGSNQYLYCFSDYHFDHANIAITRQQQRDLLQAAQEKDALCILEDPYCIDVDGALKFLEAKSYSPLRPDHTIKVNDKTLRPGIQCGCFAGFAYQCQQKNINFENVEFRPQIIDYIRAGNEISEALRLIFDPIMEDLRKNRDEELRKFYDDAIQQLQEDPLYIACMGADRKQEDGERKSRVETDIQLLGNGLLECKIMRYIYHNRARPVIFVGAGGTHIQNIEPMLRALGYRKIRTVGQDYIEAEDDSFRVHALDIQAIFNNSSFLSYKKLFAVGALIACGYCAYKIFPNFQFINQLWQSR